MTKPNAPAEPTQPAPPITPAARLRIAAKVPYPDGRGGYLPYSAIEFSVYDGDGSTGLDEAAALEALAQFHSVVMQHYEWTYRTRQERERNRQAAQSAGRPAAALIASPSEW